MADTQFRVGDSLWSLTRKLLDGFNSGAFSISTSGGGGGGGGGTTTVVQPTAANLNATVAQPTAASLNATVVQATAANLNATVTNTVAANLKVDLSGTAANATALKVDGSAVTQPISGNIGGFTTVIKDTTAVTASSAYSAGAAVGGKRTLSNAVRVTNGTGILESITILDRSNQKAAMTLFIFDLNPSAATITDHSAFVFSTNDVNVIAQVSIAASDYVTTNSTAIAQKTGLGVALKGADGTTSLYAALVTTGTPTFATTSAVQLEFGILQD